MAPFADQSTLELDAALPSPPADLRPMQPRSATRLPGDAARIVDPTWAGLRVFAAVGATEVRLLVHGADVSARLPWLVRAVSAPQLAGTLLDGELVVPHADRRSTEALVRGGAATVPVGTFVVSDLLWLAGRSLLGMPLERRRDRLERLMATGRGLVVLRAARGGRSLSEVVGLPGIAGVIAKRADSPYLPGVRSRLWTLVRVADLRLSAIDGRRDGPAARQRDGADERDGQRPDLALLRTLPFEVPA